MKPILFLTLISFSLISATSSNEISLDKCHTAFDIALDSASALNVTETVSIAKAMTFDQVYFSYDHCSNKHSEKIHCDKFRVILAPAEGPASMFTANGTIMADHLNRFKALVPGDRIIYEDISYTLDNKTYYLRPVVLIIE